MASDRPPHLRILWIDCTGRKRGLFAVRTWAGWACRVGGYGMASQQFQTYSQSSVQQRASLLAGGWGGAWRVRWLAPGLWDGAPDSGFELPGGYRQGDLFPAVAA